MKWFVLVAAALAAAVWAWIALGFPDHAHRFRLTIEVDTPDDVRTGSSVIEVERRDYGWVPVYSPGRGRVFRVRGEAVFLDLGSGRNVVAVLAHGENAEWVSEVISFWVEAYGHKRWDQDVWSGRKELRGVVELRPPLIPTLVTFADPLDPATVRVVRPGEFEQVFGPGFRFRRATLEVVPLSVPVTGGAIERRLPWLVGMRTNLAGTEFSSTNDLRERLGPGNFKRQDP
jgi:hypothetical protein